jgi:hypothetical protein
MVINEREGENLIFCATLWTQRKFFPPVNFTVTFYVCENIVLGLLFLRCKRVDEYIYLPAPPLLS